MISMRVFLGFMVAMLICLYVLVFVMIFIHHAERKDLYTRIMSGSLAEYNRDEVTPPKQPKSAHNKVLERWRKVSDEQ